MFAIPGQQLLDQGAFAVIAGGGAQVGGNGREQALRVAVAGVELQRLAIVQVPFHAVVG